MAWLCVQTVKQSFGSFRWRLFGTLLLRAIFPAVYMSVRVHILGWNPIDGGILDVASQIAWIQILFKVCDEAILQPLFFCLGKNLGDRDIIKNRFITGLMVCATVYLIFAGLLISITWPLADKMGQDPTVLAETVDYLRLETAASFAGSIANFFLVVILINSWSGFALCTLAIQMSVSVLLDIFLVSTVPISLQLGSKGLAYSSIGSQGAALIFSFLVCWNKLGIQTHDWTDYSSWDFRWLRKWTRVGMFSAAESSTRNLIYLFVMLRPFNVLHEQANYWLANAFIWNWPLLPLLPLAEALKIEVAINQDIGAERTSAYYVLAATWVGLMALSTPAWPWFLATVLRVKNVESVSQLVSHLSPGYTIFAFNILILGTLYGLGKTHMIFLQTVVANIFLFIYYDLIRQNILNLTIQNLVIMFNIGVALATATSVLQYQFLIRKKTKDEEEVEKTLQLNS